VSPEGQRLFLYPYHGTVLLDAGTTALALARVFPDRELTTDPKPVGLELTVRRNLQVYLIGGRARGRTLADVDDWTTGRCSSGAGRRSGSAQRVVALADHTKVGEENAVRFASIEKVDALVTDAGLSQADRQALEDAGVEMVLA
jgi:DeoR family fructose operon transcriptional repressor